MANITGGPSTFVAIAKQTAKGTPQVTPAAFVFAKFLSGTDFQPVWQYLGPVREGGDGLDQRWDMRTGQTARGTLVVNARPDITGMVTSAFYGGGLAGNPASAWAISSAPASHQFSFPQSGRTQYYTVVIQHPGADLANVLYDARPVGWTLEAMNQSPLKLTSEWVGLKYGASWGTALTPVYEGGDPFVFFGASINYPYSGSVGSWVSQYTVTAKVAVDENLYTNDLLMADVVDLTREVDVSLREVWQNATNYLNVEMAGLVAPTYNLSTGFFSSFHRYSSYTLQVQLPLVRWGDSTLTAVDPDNKTVYIDYQGIGLAAATSSIQVFLMNAHASNYLA
jgi:hypothetical protein